MRLKPYGNLLLFITASRKPAALLIQIREQLKILLKRFHNGRIGVIDEGIEDREGFAFAAGAALAHQMRGRK